MEALLTKLLEAMLGWGPQLFGAAAILVLGWLAARLARGGLRRALTRAGADPILVRFAVNFLYLSLLALVAIAALGEAGVNTTSFAAVIAGAGLAIGLAFQDTLANFSAGVLIIVFRPFAVGDFVEVAGTSGNVEEVQIFTTVLNTPDNKRVIVGNSAILGDTITNYSANDVRRIDLVFGVGYGDDLRRAKQIFEGILADHEKVLAEPSPVVAVVELADSRVNFAVRPWVATPDSWSVAFDVTEQVKLALDAAGISIPFPQRDVHLKGRAEAA